MAGRGVSVFVELDRPAIAWSMAPPRQPSWCRRLSSSATPYLYLLPALAGFAVWIYRPMIQTLRYSFERWDLLPTQPPFDVGWSNYKNLLALPQLGQALGVTGIYAGGMLLFGVLLPLLLGVLTQNVTRGRGLYRGIIFLPVLISPIVAATVFDFILAPNGGVANQLLGRLGISPLNWLLQANPARAAIVMISGWKILGVSVLIVSAGLAAISTDYYEAAAVDGASRWRTFRELTLPLMSPTLVFLVIASVLTSTQIIFPLLNTLTQGGPQYATSDIYYLLYTYGFTSFNVGLASAAAVLFFIGFGLVALIFVWLLDRLSFYDH